MLAFLQKSALSLARAHHPSRSRWLGLCIPEKSIPEAGGVGLLEAGRGKVVSAVVVALVLVVMVCVYVSVSLCVCVRMQTADLGPLSQSFSFSLPFSQSFSFSSSVSHPFSFSLSQSLIRESPFFSLSFSQSLSLQGSQSFSLSAPGRIHEIDGIVSSID